MDDWNLRDVQGWKGLKPTNSLLLCKQSNSSLKSPPGWDHKMLNQHTLEEEIQSQEDSKNNATADQRAKVMDTMAWNVALGPAKSLPMNLFMMWMSGNQIGIFPIMMLGMALFRSLQGMFAYKNSFRAFEKSSQKPLQVTLWVFGQILLVSVCVWKCNSMGLLPTHPSDWLTFEKPPITMQKFTKGLL